MFVDVSILAPLKQKQNSYSLQKLTEKILRYALFIVCSTLNEYSFSCNKFKTTRFITCNSEDNNPLLKQHLLTYYYVLYNDTSGGPLKE